jgi:hypothetical protein
MPPLTPCASMACKRDQFTFLYIMIDTDIREVNETLLMASTKCIDTEYRFVNKLYRYEVEKYILQLKNVGEPCYFGQ